MGNRFYPMTPKIEDFNIEDIAHALFNVCRFNGHCKEFYSVAQHSIYVSNCSPNNRLYGLIHDASEAYIGDMTTAIKKSGLIPAYMNLEEVIMGLICNKFGLKSEMPEEVKIADRRVLYTEARDLFDPTTLSWIVREEMYSWKVRPLSPKAAKKAFLETYEDLVCGH